MLLITHDITDPYFNLASEEYLLREFREDIIYLWRNDNAVIVGKHQNTVEEINSDYVDANGIKVVRRLTGGGAVFHDINNVNYSIMLGNEKGLFSNYEYFTEPICGYLRSLGIDARLNGRNDITIDDMKFSGNAQAVVGSRILHHGTLLFKSDFSRLAGALKPSELKIESKSVKSVKSRVTNIYDHLPSSDTDGFTKSMTTEKFMSGLIEYFEANVEGVKRYELSDADFAEIKSLAEKKYSTWEWNYGKSPKYTYRNQKKYPFGIVDLQMIIAGGMIKQARIFGDYFSSGNIEEIEDALVGKRHEIDEIDKVLAEIEVDSYIKGMGREDLKELICSRR